jgi:hypothetical protein
MARDARLSAKLDEAAAVAWTRLPIDDFYDDTTPAASNLASSRGGRLCASPAKGPEERRRTTLSASMAPSTAASASDGTPLTG